MQQGGTNLGTYWARAERPFASTTPAIVPTTLAAHSGYSTRRIGPAGGPQSEQAAGHPADRAPRRQAHTPPDDVRVSARRLVNGLSQWRLPRFQLKHD